MKTSKKYEIDMCNGPILGKILIFSMPLMLSGMLQLLFNAADIVVVGRYAGDNALAAVGSNSSLINLLTNLFVGLSIGANVLVSRYFGAKKEEELKSTVHTAMLISVYSGIILTVIGIVGAKTILGWMGAPKEVMELAVVYLRIYFLGMTATMIYNFGSAILRAVGDTKRPLYYLLFAGVVNVCLNLVFVIKLNMSVAGVALATAISQTISATLVVRCLMKEQSAIRLNIRELKIDKSKLISIIKIGVPAGVQGIVFSLSNVVIQSSVNSFGKVIVAGNSAAQSIEGFIYVAMNAFYQAAISFTGQNIGAGKIERINKIAIRCVLSVLIVGLFLGNMVLFFGESFLSLYSSSEEVIKAGMTRLGVIASCYALCGMMDVMVGILRGLGKSVVPMIVSLIGACGLRLLWIATVFAQEQYHTIRTIYMSYPITWTITLCAHIITFVIVKRKLDKIMKKKTIGVDEN